MTALFALLLAQTIGPVAPAPSPPAAASATEARYDQCVDLATQDPKAGEGDATEWRIHGGGYFARQCLGIAFANQRRWSAAADEFTSAANEAEVAHDSRAAHYWAQAGNARLAQGDPAKARSALDAALAAGTLVGLQRGEASFDRARALVLLGDLEGARADLDRAQQLAAADPLVWLASATLARRTHDLVRARTDIAHAYELSHDDASVLLEVGNIAAASGDAAGAQSAWTESTKLAPNSEAAAQARAALKQFEGTPKQ
jgi:tetratricopeptide (TPR) repeat protein